MESDTSTRLEVTMKCQQLKLLDEFQSSERLLSREAALRVLIEIALEVVSGTGDRFWDSSPFRSGDEPPRR